MPLVVRSPGNLSEDSSEEQIEALLDMPLFLGYIISFFLQGMLLVQVFAYYLSFKKDHRIIKIAVWFVFLLEWTSTIIATIAALESIVQYGQLSDLSDFALFKALSPLCGLVTLVVQSFYCYRIYALGRLLVIPAIIILLSITQCAMVITAGIISPLGVGLKDAKNPVVSAVCLAWLASTPVADLLIALTLIFLLTRASQAVPAAKTSLEKLMMICVETGLITGCAALIELIFFLAFRNSFIHFILFYMLPKLYSNALMATLNARLAIPGRKFRESGRWEWVQPDPIKEKVSFPMFAEMTIPPEDEKQVPLSHRPLASSSVSASECASTIEAFWSTYTPINKYSPAFMVNRTASPKNRVSVGSVTIFDSEDPHLANGWMICTRPESLHVRES